METKDRLLNIIKALNDNRSKLSALYSLYNSSLLVAETNRASLSEFYQQMVDYKNDLNLLSNTIYSAKKTERAEALNKNKSKINRINADVMAINKDFIANTKSYKIALQDCGSLKTEYKHEISELCKEFKSIYGSNQDAIDPIVLKGYKQQVKIIKAILDKIELLISDYNIKRNKMEEDNTRFVDLFNSTSLLIDSLKSIA